MAQFAPLRDKSLRVGVAKAIRDAIFDGSLKPGEQIQEGAIAAQMEISRGPIREALLMLEKEGLVQIQPNRGAFVRNMSEKEMAEVFSLRFPLEVMALNLARPRTTHETLDRLESKFKEIRKQAKAKQIHRMVQEIFAFHRIIWETSGHDLLNETLVRICTPYFAFVKNFLNRPNLDFSAEVEAEQLLVDFLAGVSELSAVECLQRYFSIVQPPFVEALDLLSGLYPQPSSASQKNRGR